MTAIIPDLLGTEPDLEGKVVLVTGGTGSFGRAFTRRLLDDFDLRKVIVFSRDEQKHFALQSMMRDPRLRFFVGDVRDRNRLMQALVGVDVVVHAAAMKHVPLAEYNPTEAIRTNIDGAVNLIDACIERRVRRVVALSTDKAVNPVNLYGATKLCMEKLFVAGNAYAGAGGSRFDLVRYGNVVGSKGSVVPIFLNQRETGELTLTEPSMTRFWIGMDSAIDLVLLALRDGTGGDIFVPRIPACTVQDLAEAIAPDVPHRVIGVRPGEKRHEVLITADEARNAVQRGDIFVIRPEYRWSSATADSVGVPVGDDFRFSSDIARRLTVAEVRRLLVRLRFLSAAP